MNCSGCFVHILQMYSYGDKVTQCFQSPGIFFQKAHSYSVKVANPILPYNVSTGTGQTAFMCIQPVDYSIQIFGFHPWIIRILSFWPVRSHATIARAAPCSHWQYSMYSLITVMIMRANLATLWNTMAYGKSITREHLTALGKKSRFEKFWYFLNYWSCWNCCCWLVSICEAMGCEQGIRTRDYQGA